MTVAEIGCGRCLQSTDSRTFTRSGYRGREYGISSAGDEQEPISESPSVRLLSARGQVGPGTVNPNGLIEVLTNTPA